VQAGSATASHRTSWRGRAMRGRATLLSDVLTGNAICAVGTTAGSTWVMRASSFSLVSRTPPQPGQQDGGRCVFVMRSVGSRGRVGSQQLLLVLVVGVRCGRR